MSQPAAHVNRLHDETSPYLRQHAHNPVDWYPWGPAALARARERDVPIFLSIGYSACHWCHVMERESFEDEAVGRFLNEHFVSVKVDREERPDLDRIYMDFVVQTTGHGGWPMSVFLTPDGRPFFGGTYFPPDNRYGGRMPSFRQVLESVVGWWTERRDEVERMAGQNAAALAEELKLPEGRGDRAEELLRNAGRALARSFDHQYGGFGQAPKFPHPMDLRLLLRLGQRFGDETAREMVRKTLDHMARGGIYDQLGGGFHRYSTDARWLVPHFEKMLYDNALLTVTYLEAYQATGDAEYRGVVEETLAYVEREMTSPDGPFYSTQDADSEGVEGKFFVWTRAEVEAILGKPLAERFAYVYDVTPGGNWHEFPGANILNRSRSWEQDARMLGVPADELRRDLAEARRQLFASRARRVKPGRDEKVLTAWNGLMIDAFAAAAAALDQPAWAARAEAAADFVLTRMRGADGKLSRTWFTGSEPKLNAYLEDYAYLLNGLVSLYEATLAPRWLEEAVRLTATLLDQFWDETGGGFYFTGRDHEQLIARTKDWQDNATPSGNAVAVTALLRLAKLTGRRDLEEKAVRTLRVAQTLLERAPAAAGQMLLALDFHLGPVQEVAVVGDRHDPETVRALRALRRGFAPHQVIAWKPATGDTARHETAAPLLAGKDARGPVTVYVCRDFTCAAPLVGAAVVEERSEPRTQLAQRAE